MAELPRSTVGATETHISTLFFTPSRAYKLLKPIDTGFLDHRSVEARCRSIDRELTLNRRIAPDVYLGTADVHEGEELADRMLVMQRMPAERRLSTRLNHESAPDDLRAVARTVAAFHASLDPIRDPAGPGGFEAHRSLWVASLREMDEFVGPVLDEEAHSSIGTLALEYVDGHRPLFDDRVEKGMIRDGHGDLLADDIFCLDDGPRILDCLAFNDEFRIGDVLSDICFLVMDVERLAGPQLAAALMRWYVEFSNEHHPGSLAHHYVAYRALVRAKVACLRWAQGDEDSYALARTHHRQCFEHLRRGQTRMVLVGGGPGTGKTTIADRIAAATGWVALGSDTIRKEVTGVSTTTHSVAEPDAGIYTSQASAATYGELLERAEKALRAGESVVLDASWTSAEQRAAAADVCTRFNAELIEFECRIDPAIARERVTRRLADVWDPSDATPQIVDHLAGRHDDWPTAIEIDTAHPIDECAARALQCLDAGAIRSYSAA